MGHFLLMVQFDECKCNEVTAKFNGSDCMQYLWGVCASRKPQARQLTFEKSVCFDGVHVGEHVSS